VAPLQGEFIADVGIARQGVTASGQQRDQGPDPAAQFKWTNNWSVAATFQGEFSNCTSSYAGKGVVRDAW
jgi:hypothetical protein